MYIQKENVSVQGSEIHLFLQQVISGGGTICVSKLIDEEAEPSPRASTSSCSLPRGAEDEEAGKSTAPSSSFSPSSESGC